MSMLMQIMSTEEVYETLLLYMTKPPKDCAGCEFGWAVCDATLKVTKYWCTLTGSGAMANGVRGCDNTLFPRKILENI